MTKLWIFSDLHIEQSHWDLPTKQPDFDVMVAAGDIHCSPAQAVAWLAERAHGKPIVFVPGNHEWYSPMRDRSVAEERLRGARVAAEAGVHLLLDQETQIEGLRFLGSTLWTDYALDGDVETSMRIAERSMNDHLIIFPDTLSRPLRAETAREWHFASRRWLEARLAEDTDVPTVVVTHHLPHPRSIAQRYQGDPLNPAFCSDLAEMVEKSDAAMWIHGHTHHSCDYRAAATRVVCNPKGYGPRRPGGQFENEAFDPRLVIEVS